MRQHLNEGLIKRYSNVSKMLIFIGMGMLIGGLVISLTRPQEVNPLLILALGGTILSQVGITLHNRWGRRPRMDEIIDSGLKGLDKRYATFHYALGVPHALISPAGVFTLLPRLEKGEIVYEGGDWWQIRERRGLLRRGGRKKLRGLETHAKDSEAKLQNALARALPEQKEVAVGSILVFLHQEAQVEVEEAPILTMHIKKIKDQIRRLPNDKSLDEKEIELLAQSLKL